MGEGFYYVEGRGASSLAGVVFEMTAKGCFILGNSRQLGLLYG